MGNSSSKTDESFDENKIEFDITFLDEIFRETKTTTEDLVKTEDLNKYFNKIIYIGIFDEKDEQINRNKLLQTIGYFINKVNTKFDDVFETYFSSNNNKEISKEATKNRLIKLISICEYFNGKKLDIKSNLSGFDGPISCLFLKEELLTYPHLYNEIYLNFPRLSSIAKNSILKALHYKNSINVTPTVESEMKDILTPVVFWFLCFTLPECYLKPPAATPKNPNDQLYVGLDGENEYGKWSLLYNSNIHGQSLNRFKNHCFDYRAPTLTFIKLNSGQIFVLACDTEWREDVVFWGGLNCVLYQYSPSFIELARGKDIIYLKENSRINKTGIRLGGSMNRPIVYLNSDFDTCDINLNGYLNEKVLMIEVWGTGDKLTEEKMKQQKKMNEEDIIKRQKIKINGEKWSENPDFSLLEMAGVKVSHNQDRPC